MEAAGAFLVSRGSEDAERLPVQVLETRADKWTQGASMLQGISLKKRRRGRERENDWHGETKLLQWARPHYFIFQMVLLYLASYIEGNERCKVIQSQLKHYICFAFIETRIFSAYLSHKWCCVQYLLALEACEQFMTFFFDKGCSTRKLIFPQSIFSLYF